GNVLVDLVPAHMGHLGTAAIAVDAVFLEVAHLAGEDVQAVDAAVFLTVTHQCLQTHANAQHRLFGDGLCHRLVEAAGDDAGHAVADGANPGEHHPIGLGDLGLVGSDHHLGPGGNGFQGLVDGVQVAHAVVDHGDADSEISHWLESSLGSRHHAGP